jgi:hypothetical protein
MENCCQKNNLFEAKVANAYKYVFQEKKTTKLESINRQILFNSPIIGGPKIIRE